jgi:hypothetical protein
MRAIEAAGEVTGADLTKSRGCVGAPYALTGT